MPSERRWPTGFLEVKGARENNLKNIDVKFPLGIMTVVTGVSGSGKSSLVNEILYKSLAKKLNRARMIPGKHDEILGAENLDKIIDIDQSPADGAVACDNAVGGKLLLRQVEVGGSGPDQSSDLDEAGLIEQ